MSSSIQAIKRELNEQGYATFRTSQIAFERLAREFGKPVSARRGGPTLDRLVPTRSENASPRSLSAEHGTGPFPFHTDAAHHATPPRYVLLRLADGARTTTPTLLADFNAFSFTTTQRLALSREQWLVNGGLGRVFYSAIVDAQRSMIRFDPGCMTEPAATSLTGQEILARSIRQAKPIEVAWKSDLSMVIDNWRMLHARPPTDEVDRQLLRVMVRP